VELSFWDRLAVATFQKELRIPLSDITGGIQMTRTSLIFVSVELLPNEGELSTMFWGFRVGSHMPGAFLYGENLVQTLTIVRLFLFSQDVLERRNVALFLFCPETTSCTKDFPGTWSSLFGFAITTSRVGRSSGVAGKAHEACMKIE
jgi:hypothetical protein